MKKKIGILCLAMCGIIFLCFYLHTKNKVEDVVVPQNTVYLGRDEEKIKKHLAGFPNDFESLKEERAFFITKVYTSGREYWEDFLEKVSNKEKSSVDIIRFGHEGEPIISYLEYDGKNFYQVTDFNRVDSLSGYVIEKYSYMNYLDVPEDEYEGLNFSVLEGNVKEVILSDEKFNNYGEYRDFLQGWYSTPDDTEENLESFVIWPMTEENYQEMIAKMQDSE